MAAGEAAYRYALWLLGRRDYSASTLLEKMLARATAEEAHSALLRLQTEGWQSDQRFAESYIRYRASLGFGPRHIRYGLIKEGVASEVVALAFESVDIDWDQEKARLRERKFKNQDEPKSLKERAKQARFLYQRGF
ncbi:MAG: regulatory protein RecX [Gammaproteobacteria bacterium]|nr:regulatory protein RecX [Gammaproteobacteria bacterium]